MCKTRTLVYLSSTESEVISSDAGLRMDGTPALDLWDVVIEVLRSSQSTESPTNPVGGNCSRDHKSKPKQQGEPRCWSIVACGPRHHKRKFFSRRVSVVHLWSQWNCDQNEKKDEAQQWDTCRELTELLLIVCLTESTWNPKIQIKYVDTKNQLADMLTKGSFTRDEWDHLLRLVNIMNISVFSCSHFLSNCMSKRAQGSKTEEGPAEAKPRPMSLVSRNLLSAKQTTGKPVRDSSQDPTTHSQEWQQDDNPLRGAWRFCVEWWVLRVQEGQGNRCEVSITSLRGQGWKTTICKAPTMDTLKKSSRTFDRKLSLSEDA